MTYQDGGTNTQTLPTSGGVPTNINDTIDSRIAVWAKIRNTTLIPAAKLRIPTASSRGAPLAVTNAIIDDDSFSAATLYAWSRAHVKRLIERLQSAPAPESGGLTFPDAGFAEGINVTAARNMRTTGIAIPTDAYFMLGVEFPADGSSETPSAYDIIRRADLLAVDVIEDGNAATSGDYVRLFDRNDLGFYAGQNAAGELTFSATLAGIFDVRIVRLA